MKTQRNGSPAVTKEIPPPAPGMVAGIQNTKPMKTGLRLLIVLCSAVATTAAFGQATTFIWTNQNLAVNAEIGFAANWNPNGIPNPNSNVGFPGDEIQFNGQTIGPLFIQADTGMNGGSSAGVVGLVIHLTGNQTNPVNFYYPHTTGHNSTSVRTANIQVDAGAGQLSLGDTNTAASLYFVMGGLGGQIHNFVNNSANPVIMYPGLRWAMGGGGTHTFVFDGPGDWLVTNSLVCANGSDTIVTKQGTGTMIWQYGANAEDALNSQISSPFTINAGKVILQSGNLLNNVQFGNVMVNNGTLFEYDGQTNAVGSVSDGTISLSISGTGSLQVNNGTLTLAGNSTYTGTNFLTGGELIAGSVETANPSGPLGEPSLANIPLAGTISFQGGTLGYSAFNGFDYSPRFDTSPGQQYRIDTASANVTYTNGLTSSGGSLVKLGGGSLTLAGADTYNGLTTVVGGKLVLAGTASSGNITVDDSAAVGVVENGTPFTPNTLTLGTNSGAIFEANNVTNKNAAPLQPNTLAFAGTTTVNVNSGRFRLIGDTFPLLTWSSGLAPGTTLGFLAGAGGRVVTNISGKELDLIIDQPPFVWTGNNNGTWDNTITPNNWTFSGSSAAWTNGNYALFDDSLTANNSVTISGVLSGKTITFANVNTNYTLTSVDSLNNLGGSTSLTMGGSGTTTLAGGANSYTGVTTITGGGTLSVGALANGGAASDIGAASSAATNLVLNGGTLLYTGGSSSIDRLFTVGTAGGIIDNEGAGTLTLNNTGSMGLNTNISSGPRNLTLRGVNTSGDVLATVVGDGGGPTSLTKNGAGTWILTGTNTYSGGTTIVAGELIVGAGGSGGTLGLGPVNDATALDFNRSGTVTVVGTIIGPGSVTNDGPGTVILANNNLYSGGTTINAGTLQLGNGGGSGALNPNIGVVNNSLLTFNSSGTHVLNGVISGPGNVIVSGGGYEQCLAANTYTGWTRIDAGTIFQPCTGNQGALASSSVTNNGILRLIRQDNGVFTYPGIITGSGSVQVGANNFNPGDVTLTGVANNWTGGTFIGGNILILGDGSTIGSGAFVGNVTFTNNWTTTDDNVRKLDIRRVDDYTIAGNIVTNFASPQGNLGIIQLDGSANVTLTGNNTYGGGTVINGGSVIVGTGGSSGSLGKGNVTNNTSTTIVINRSGSLTIPGAISGAASPVTLIGSGTVALTSTNNTYVGATTVSNGTLVATTIGSGDLNLEGGTVEVRGLSSVANLNVTGNMNIDSGTVVATVNKGLSPSNTTYTVTGTITNATGTTLQLIFAGNQALVPGDKFTIFNQPLTNGAAMNIVSPEFAVTNNLALDGSVTVTAGTPPFPVLTNKVVSGTNLVLSWSPIWIGSTHLQGQTNRATVGLSNNWVDVSGTSATNVYTTTINKTNGCVFYRFVFP